MRILVVEDDRLLNNTLCYNLSVVGYKVDAAMTKAEAAALYEKRDYDLAVLDVNLPDGNGFDFCRELKERRPDTFLTVWISVRKPAKIAGSVSPIEAIRYTESDAGAFRRKGAVSKKSTGGAKIYRMALSNLGRNRKRTLLVILSMTLSLVLFHTVFTLSRGFDIEKYVAKFVNKDFVISTADYFNYKFETSEMELTTSFVEAVRQHEAFLDGGGLYSTRTLEEAFSAESGAVSSYNKDEKGNPYVQFFGADDFLLGSMEAVEGTID